MVHCSLGHNGLRKAMLGTAPFYRVVSTSDQESLLLRSYIEQQRSLIELREVKTCSRPASDVHLNHLRH